MPLSNAFLEILRTDRVILPNESITTAEDNSSTYLNSSDDEDPSG